MVNVKTSPSLPHVHTPSRKELGQEGVRIRRNDTASESSDLGRRGRAGSTVSREKELDARRRRLGTTHETPRLRGLLDSPTAYQVLDRCNPSLCTIVPCCDDEERSLHRQGATILKKILYGHEVVPDASGDARIFVTATTV